MSGSRGADTLCCEGGLPTGLAAGLGAVAILALGCGSPPAEPDGSWAVTVTGLETDCTDSSEGYQKSFTYQLFYDETDLSLVELRIDDESFATGFVSGCSISYQSAIWLEEDDGGNYRWQIVGEAEHQGAAGGCEIPDDRDWYGSETLVIVDSENEDVPAGCIYEMSAEGNWAG